jgi:ribonucleotide reductase beta subunit family protein with ferritin-like domain
MLPRPLQDLTAEGLKEFTKVVANSLLVQVGYRAIYEAKNPFTWMGDIDMESKTNFYEGRVGQYKKKSLMELLDWKKRAGLVTDTTNVFTDPGEVDF